MSQYIDFYNRNETLKVSISFKELKRMHRLCTNSNPYETGGILVGYYSPDNHMAVITEITAQPPSSKQGLTRFFRSSANVLQHLNSKWIKGEYYLGEWHYHPNCSPSPSLLDIQTIKMCSSNRKLHCPEPILLIIGGNMVSGWNEFCGIVFNNDLISLTKG